MDIKKVQTKKVEILTDVICDSCGQSCKVFDGVIENDTIVDNGEPYCEFNYMELNATWGYYSNKDNEEWVAKICEKCVDEKLSFIKFIKKPYL